MIVVFFEKRRRLFNVAVLLIIIDAHVKYYKAGKGVSFNAFCWKLFRNDLYQQKHKKIKNRKLPISKIGCD